MWPSLNPQVAALRAAVLADQVATQLKTLRGRNLCLGEELSSMRASELGQALMGHKNESEWSTREWLVWNTTKALLEADKCIAWDSATGMYWAQCEEVIPWLCYVRAHALELLALAAALLAIAYMFYWLHRRRVQTEETRVRTVVADFLFLTPSESACQFVRSGSVARAASRLRSRPSPRSRAVCSARCGAPGAV